MITSNADEHVLEASVKCQVVYGLSFVAAYIAIHEELKKLGKNKKQAMKRQVPFLALKDNEPEPLHLLPKRRKMDHSYAKRLSPRKFNQLEYRVKKQKEKICVLQKSVKRKNQTLATVLKKGESLNILDVDHDVYYQHMSPIMSELVKAENKTINTDRRGFRYTEELKKFALSIHFYSPKAYRFLKEYLVLPHESTISDWMSGADCSPGICLDAINRLSEHRKNDSSNTLTDIVLQVDEMAIRKDTPYDSSAHCFVGHVDYGLGDSGDNAPIATNAMVCLAVGLSGGWKCPVGYIFTNKVNGEIMFTFVRRILDTLLSRNFRVHGIVSDGYSANVNMFRLFGVKESKNSGSKSNNAPQNVSEVQCSFKYGDQSEPIHCIYDVVHMIKLLRNMLADYKNLEFDGGVICWSFINELYKLQSDEHIRAANKLSRNHIEFDKHKMKVKLAAQVLSASVASAIEFCDKDLKLPQFKGSQKTVQFIKMIDQMFDILNSKNPNQKYFKSPLNKSNVVAKVNYLNQCSEKILSLKYKGSFVSLGQRKRAVVGLVTSIKSITSISIQLLNRPISPFSYVLTYRFSQDLLELLFNKIRGKLGRNNNPNVIEFKNIMKQIWHQNLLKSNSTGNAIVRVKECEVPGGLLPLERKKKSRVPVINFDITTHIDTIIYSTFHMNCLSYIAGNIVRDIRCKLDCSICFDSLHESSSDPLSSENRALIIRKDNGGLVYPSGSVLKVVELTDNVMKSVFKQTATPPSIKWLDLKICSAVMKRLLTRDDLFVTLKDHINDFCATQSESHLVLLLKMIIQKYLRIKLFDHGKVSHETISERHQRSKLTLFRNE